MIADIINDKHAVLTMDENNSELKILLSHLRSKLQELDHAKLSQVVIKSSQSVNY
jgi:hypothetical protein